MQREEPVQIAAADQAAGLAAPDAALDGGDGRAGARAHLAVGRGVVELADLRGQIHPLQQIVYRVGYVTSPTIAPESYRAYPSPRPRRSCSGPTLEQTRLAGHRTALQSLTRNSSANLC